MVEDDDGVAGVGPLDYKMSVLAPSVIAAQSMSMNLDLTRLFVETADLEVLDAPWFLSRWASLVAFYGTPRTHPALKYLCKQDFFDFDLSKLIATAFAGLDGVRSILSDNSLNPTCFLMNLLAS